MIRTLKGMPGILAAIGLAVLIMVTGCARPVPQQAVKVEIVKTDSGYQLLRAGKPYEVRGAGMAVDDIARFAAHGGNSIRNWSTSPEYQDTQALLDNAYANGVTVALCLSLVAERHGFDYSDPVAVAEQLAWVRKEVEKYRDHPALLAWIIGNELNHSHTNPAVFDAVNEVALLIKELDPNHPTTTTLAEPDAHLLSVVLERAPALDFISVQTYGALFGLPAVLQEIEFDAPLMVTEWGTIGYWEMQQTFWGAPHEITSTKKADTIRRGLHEIMPQLEPNLIGSYVFLWGQKQERTPTWFGLLTVDGDETESIDILHKAWTGSWPGNRTPQVQAMLLDGQNYEEDVMLVAGVEYTAALEATDPDGDALQYRWEVKPESDARQAGGDRELLIENVEGVVADNGSATVTITAPQTGNYRLFAYAFDDKGKTAHANIPFRVGSDLAQDADALVDGQVMAMSYSGYREGQHPDRGDGANNPSDEEVLEDLQILVANDYELIRLYDAGENSQQTLRLIREHDLPITVLLGMWLRAEFSNHEGCPWLDEPIPESELADNKVRNELEIQTGIQLARQYDDIVVAVNVGNEALVDWNDHMVPVEDVIAYVKRVKASIEQPVTVADNYLWWANDGAELVAAVDFIGLHTYPVWEGKTIDEALPFTLQNLQMVRDRFPDKPYAILEAGWPTTASEFGDLANVAAQVRYIDELNSWATRNNVTVFLFEAFDEPWKGDPGDPLGAEKHWGLFYVDRTPKHSVSGEDE
ncbi:MAG: glycosyl hydrolase family 17 protein [Woeseiaceae bacterium]